MAIKVKSKAAPLAGPHAEAAAALAATGTVVVTETDDAGQQVDQQVAHETFTVKVAPPPHGSVTVGMAYKFPAGAQYHMLEVTVSRTTPCIVGDEDDVFNETKEWVEERLNATVAENSPE